MTTELVMNTGEQALQESMMYLQRSIELFRYISCLEPRPPASLVRESGLQLRDWARLVQIAQQRAILLFAIFAHRNDGQLRTENRFGNEAPSEAQYEKWLAKCQQTERIHLAKLAGEGIALYIAMLFLFANLCQPWKLSTL